MSYAGWAVLLICLLSGLTLFFSVNAIALRTFSLAKIQEALKAKNKKDKNHEGFIDKFVEDPEKLILAFLKETEREIRLMLEEYSTTDVLGLTISLMEVLLMERERDVEPYIADVIKRLWRQFPEWTTTLQRAFKIVKGPRKVKFTRQFRRFMQDFHKRYER